MMKTLRIVFLFLIFLGTLWGGYTLVYHSNTYTQCIGEFGNKPASNVECSIRTLDAHNGIVTAFGTLLLVVVTAGLIQQAVRQELATQQQLRAYCMVTEARIENFAVGKTPIAQIIITNCGQTPAKNFNQVSTMGLDSFPPSLNPPDFTSAKMTEHPLAPGKEIFASPRLAAPLNPDQIKSLQDGKTALYAVGKITYTDAFGKKRSTNYNLFSNGLTDISQGKMGATPESNNFT